MRNEVGSNSQPFIRLVLTFAISLAAYNIALSQTAAPSINYVSPVGVERGKTATLTVTGINLGGADRVYFSHSGLTGKVVEVKDLGPETREIPKGFTGTVIKDIAHKFSVVIEVKVAEDAPPGRQTFRLGTTLGASTSRAIAVGYLPQAKENEPNNNLAEARQISLPATAAGMIGAVGDKDVYAFEAVAGQELVFEVVAATLQSPLDSTLELLDAAGRVIAANEDFDNRTDSLLAYKFPTGGKYFIRVSEALTGVKKGSFYLLNVGELAFVTSIFPLGAQKGTTAEFSVQGHNLHGLGKLNFNSPESALWGERVNVPVTLREGELWNRVRASVGAHPEVMEAEGNDDLRTAQTLTLPATVNGHISPGKGSAQDKDFFKWTAKRGQQISISVAAQRLGSALDSYIEILDAKGKQIPRAIVRPLLETYTTLRDHDSTTSGVRLASTTGLAADDYLLVGGELMRVAALPPDPDSETNMDNFMGQRRAFEGTTPVGHALDTPVYKVAVYKPDALIPSGGTAPITITYNNDDGGLMYGRDSYINFTAPADGAYFVRLTDVRGGVGGDNFAYRLTLAERSPDYTLTVNPGSPNVPLGGSVHLTVTANRIDGFDGAIDVKLENLPKGLTATTGKILPGHFTTVLTISCPADLVNAARLSGSPLRVAGSAAISGEAVSRIAETDDPVSIISVAAPPELFVYVAQKEVRIEPGGTGEVTVAVKRADGFTGRVPVSVRNLPRNTTVKVGLNGVLVTESETSRTFKIEADAKAAPLEQLIYVTGTVETNSLIRSEYSAEPIKLIIVPKQSTVASAPKN
ncbi:MAG TPA: PPC domain-containing protein [Pyrinomonadaceae bacterium]|nr:PPC domain-containing protein [Pyrinomonadaceae bacterium]